MPRPRDARLDNAANRRMCAGTYLDHAFRDRLLREIYNDCNRRVAPSYGFDVVLVLQHAWRAWWLEVGQHLAVLAVLVVALLRIPFATVIAVSALAIWYLLRSLPDWAEDLTAYYGGRRIEISIRQMQARGRFLRRCLLGAFLILLAAMVTAFAQSDRPGQLKEAWVERTGLAGAGLILAVLSVVVAATAAVRLASSGQLRTTEPQRGGLKGHRMRVIDDQQRHPVTVHSGFRPFIGSGVSVRNWSFAQRLIQRKVAGTEPDEEYIEPPFTAQDLVDRLKKMISELRTDDHPETRLPGLDVADHIFVEGTHAGAFRHILGSHPDGEEIHDAIADAVANPSDVARHYLACRVVSWGGEVVTSVFVHVSLQGRTLYLEFSTYALLPTRSEYHLIDQVGGTGPRAAVKAIARGLVNLPEELLTARRLAHAPTQLWAALQPGKDRTVKARPRLDIGASVSAREAAATDADESYFQFQDILQHSKIIERRLIATVGDYLRELGVDTSEFWVRAQTILNNGVINAGSGTVNISGSAIGDQASVTNEAPPPPAE